VNGVGAGPKNTPAAADNTRLNSLADVNGLCREAIEALPAAVYMTDAEGRITFYNEAAAALWGCRPELGDSKFCGSWKLYQPDGTPLPHDECPMAMALHQKRPIRGVEAVAERPDGTRIPFIPYPTPLFDATGRLSGAVNMLVDISERKLTEQHKQRLASIVDSSEDAIISKDLSGIITSWNPGAERLFGYVAEEMIGKSITLLIPPDLRHEEAKILERLGRGGRVEHFETTRMRKDGSLVRVSLSVSPVRNAQGGVVGASKIARDVTERNKAEELQKSEQVLRELLGGLPAAVYVTDAAGRITCCNESAVNLWGTRPKLGEDRWCDLGCFYHPDGKRMELGNCPTEIALKQGRCVRGHEAIFERTDGTRIPIIPYPTPLRDFAGAIIGVVNMTVDISTRKQAARSRRTQRAAGTRGAGRARGQLYL
jgi:PAS domain S-box-containing protein